MTFIVDAPGVLDLTAWQGSVFVRTFTVTGENLTGYLARLQVRSKLEADSTLISVDSSTIGGITWPSASTGVLKVTISAVVLALIEAGTWVYDLELVPPNSPSGWIEASATKLLVGAFTVKREITR